MTRSLKALGLLAIGVLAFSVPASADNDGVSFDGNILWNNNGGGAQYDQSVYGALNQTTETFVTSNFPNNRIVDPLLGTGYDTVAGPWRPTSSSPALYGNGAPVVNASDVDAFFKDVPYQGALGSSPSGDWTRGWIYTNLQGGLGRTDIDLGKPVVNVTGDVTSNTTWTAANNYTLTGRIAVTNGATLTIEPGVVVIGLVAGSYLVVERDGMIDAVGSTTNPIIFTSGADFTTGSQAPGDWAGIVIHGNAVANCAAGGAVAGCNSTTTGNDCESEGGAGFFGGSNDADDRGRLIFVRSEYAGQEISPNNELNAFTFNALGSGTTLQYLQAHRGTDDCFEWFGGNTRSSYFVGTGGNDDGLDWQMGYHGFHQFAVIVFTALDGADGDNGMECDNNEYDYSCPDESNGIMANLTLIGEPTLTGHGIHFRRGTNGGVLNSIITNFQAVGFRMQHDETFDNGVGARPSLYTAPPPTGIGGESFTQSAFRVSLDRNPVFGNSHFMFSLARTADVKIRVFNIQGRLVDTVYSGALGEGAHMIGWNPRSSASGVYLYQVQAGNQVATGKLTVVN